MFGTMNTILIVVLKVLMLTSLLSEELNGRKMKVASAETLFFLCASVLPSVTNILGNGELSKIFGKQKLTPSPRNMNIHYCIALCQNCSFRRISLLREMIKRFQTFFWILSKLPPLPPLQKVVFWSCATDLKQTHS